MNDDLFLTVKNSVSLIEFVEGETGSKAKKVGATLRINPCPLPGCGHNDCFTIYPSDNSFRCFSCGGAGDVICFQRLHKRLPDNFESAKSIARKRGLSIDNQNGSRQSKKNPKRSEKKFKGGPNIDPERANALRGIVADFYHKELLHNKKALDYQIKKRGHSEKILKQFRVGYASKESLIKYVKGRKYSVEDLIRIGLVRNRGKGYGAIIPEGFFIYPHTLNGQVLFFSIKDPTGKKKFQIKKVHAGQGWLGLNQDALSGSGPIILVEGENDLLSVIDKAKVPDVFCIVGNFNTPNILTNLRKHAEGKVFYLAFDRDEAGVKYKSQYGKAVLNAGGEARVIEVPKPFKDIDEFLKASKNLETDFAELVQKAKIIVKASTGGPVTHEAHGSGFLVSRFDSFEVLGELGDGRIAFWSKVKRRPYIFSLKDFNLDALDQIGGEEIRHKVVRSAKELKDGKTHFFGLKRDIIVEAGKNLLGEERWLGQGISLLEDERLLILSGDEAMIWDGKSFEPYEKPMIEKKFLRRASIQKWIDMRLLQKMVLGMTRQRGDEIFRDAIHLIQQWGFMSPYDELLVAGFLLAQMIQTTWKWRSHLWVSGSQGSGKTLLIELFDRIAGKLSKRYEGQTLSEPGFRQDLKDDLCLCQIDEFEKSSARQELLDLLRSAGRGGSSTKGSSSGKAVHYSIRHMVVVASIERGLIRATEKHRFIIIEMNKNPQWNPQIPSLEKAEQLRMNFFSYALWVSFRAKELISQLGRVGTYESRLVEAYAVPLSMMCIIDHNPLGSLEKYLFDILNSRKDYADGDLPEDEVSLLEDILTSTIRVPKEDGGHTIYSDQSIIQLLKVQSDVNEGILQAHGIKLCSEGLFLAPQIVERKLLKDTRWKELNIRSMLGRLPAAQNTQRRLGGPPLRGILIVDLPSQIKFLEDCDGVTEV